jgi:hypothetical protein
MFKPAVSDVYFLSSCNCSVFDFFVVLQEISGIERPPFLLSKFPLLVASNTLTFLNGLITRYDSSVDPVWAEMGSVYWDCSSDKAKSELKFDARDPRVTLRDTVQWITQNKSALKKRNKQTFLNINALMWSLKILLLFFILFLCLYGVFSYRAELFHSFAEFRAFSKEQYKKHF